MPAAIGTEELAHDAAQVCPVDAERDSQHVVARLPARPIHDVAPHSLRLKSYSAEIRRI